jgi:Prokaryotic membrane lipoprotein lipid attachment site
MRRILAVTVAVLALASCSAWDDDRGKGDAPVKQAPDREITVHPNGDGFPNIAQFCVGPNGIYTTTREAPPVVIPNDPICEESGISGG